MFSDETIFGCEGTETLKMQLPDFLKDDSTRTVLSWVGGGFVTVVAAGWAIFKFWRSKPKHSLKPSVGANNGSISAGRDIRDNKIEMHSDRKR
jgi:hypothetical protein